MKQTFLILLLVFALPLFGVRFEAKAQFFYDEPGKNSTGIFTLHGANPQYTGNGVTDPVGDGWIRLTSKTQNELGYVILDKTFPSTMGVTIEFDFKIWGATAYPDPENGFCVFLINATDNAGPFTHGGAKGEGLGFTRDASGYGGASPAYLGVGIDAYGGFAQTGNGKTTGEQTRAPETVSLRTGTMITPHYYFLRRSNQLIYPDILAYRASYTTTRPPDGTYYRRLRVDFDPIGNDGVKVTVYYKTAQNGGYTQLFTYDYQTGTNAFIARPDTLRVGFSATTSNSSDRPAYNEIRNVLIRTPGVLTVTKQPIECPGVSASPNTNTKVQTTVACISNTTHTITVADTLPHNFVVVGNPTTSHQGQSVNGVMGTPSITTAGDGRKVYTYTLSNMGTSRENIHVTFEGYFSAMPPNGKFATAARISASPNVSIPQGQSPITYSKYTGSVKHLVAVSPPAGAVLYKTGTPVSFSVNTGSSNVKWEYSTDGGTSWQYGGSGAAYTPAAGLFNGNAFPVRCTADFGNNCTDILQYSCIAQPDNVSDITCFIQPPSTSWSFRLLAETPLDVPDPSDNNTLKGIVSSYGIPLVGDIDNDGTVEIIAPAVGIMSRLDWGALPVTVPLVTDKLRILTFNGSSFSLKQTINTPFYNIIGNGYAIAKVDGDNQPAAIFLSTSIRSSGTNNNSSGDRQQLIKYTLQGGIYKEATRKPYFKSGETGYDKKEVAQPMIADFNGDGIPEVVAYGRIFNARTMDELVRLDIFQTGYSSGQGAHTNNLINGESSSIMAIADMDGDGLPELVAGDCVYKVIIDPVQPSNNQFYRWKKCAQLDFAGNTHAEVKDGATAVADIDLDGQLDVIVSVPGSARSTTQNDVRDGAIYVWNPRTERVIHTNKIDKLPSGIDLITPPAPGSGPSVAFVGDIDNDGTPDICFTSREQMTAMYFDTGNKQLMQKWNRATNDKSGSTSMAVFDFNQDGENELVYRDQDNLRILDKNGNDKITPIAFGSLTQNEYPVVADIDGDGHAEILITGTENKLDWVAQLRVYSSNPAGMWAPARKVWNQFAYNAVNINEDLTVPRMQLNPATVFPGGKRPFNGYLQQQTYLNREGNPLWPAAHARHDASPSYKYNAETDSLTITVRINNAGNYPFYPPFKVTVYKNTVGSSTSKTYSFAETVNPGDMITRTLGIKNFNAQWAPFDKLIILLNDAGNGASDQTVCSISMRDYELTPDVSVPIARNDRISVIACNSKTVNVLANDINTGGISTLYITKNGALGTAASASPNITYSMVGASGCDAHGGKCDTIIYTICAGVNCSSARLLVDILRRPSIVLRDSCSHEPYLTFDYRYPAAEYKWYVSQNGSSWTQVTGSPHMTLYVTATAWYKVRITYNGETVETTPVRFIVNRKHRLPPAGNLMWYDTSLIK
jgi:hypothetical protein